MPEDQEGGLKNNLYLLFISKKYETRSQAASSTLLISPLSAYFVSSGHKKDKRNRK
jgi:hypothetical protein